MNFVEGREADRHGANTIGIRPEHFAVSTTPVEGAWKGEVSVAEHLGADTFVHLNAGSLGTINVANRRRGRGQSRRHDLSHPGPGAHPPFRRGGPRHAPRGLKKWCMQCAWIVHGLCKADSRPFHPPT